jgi:hypothetical protein
MKLIILLLAGHVAFGAFEAGAGEVLDYSQSTATAERRYGTYGTREEQTSTVSR